MSGHSSFFPGSGVFSVKVYRGAYLVRFRFTLLVRVKLIRLGHFRFYGGRIIASGFLGFYRCAFGVSQYFFGSQYMDGLLYLFHDRVALFPFVRVPTKARATMVYHVYGLFNYRVSRGLSTLFGRVVQVSFQSCKGMCRHQVYACDSYPYGNGGIHVSFFVYHACRSYQGQMSRVANFPCLFHRFSFLLGAIPYCKSNSSFFVLGVLMAIRLFLLLRY